MLKSIYTAPSTTTLDYSLHVFLQNTSRPDNRHTVTISAAIDYLNVDPMIAQNRFARSVELNEPGKIMTSYRKRMHQHTMQQFEEAAATSRKRFSGANDTTATLFGNDSKQSSMMSRADVSI
jgi:protein tyrosine/serine phosphatase